MNKKVFLMLTILIVSGLVGSCVPAEGDARNGSITASGTISVETYRVAPELSGKVTDTFFNEGDEVQVGDLLFTMDGELVEAQFSQARAAVSAAEASVAAANAQLGSAEIQLAQAEQGARMQDPNMRSQTWRNPSPVAFDLPIWYFDRAEEKAAAEQQVELAEEALSISLGDLEQELEKASSDDFLAVEQHLVEARARFNLAQLTLDQVRQAQDRVELEDAAEKEFNAAEADLGSIQQEYDRMLSTTAAEAVLAARAGAAVSEAHLQNAYLALDSFLTGDDALQVQAARSAVHQAETAVAQAEANLDQAHAGLQVLEVQRSKLEVFAPVEGIVTARNIREGEIAPAGSTIYVIGQLEEVTLTVYIPEDQYGRIRLGQEAEVRVDSFPGKVFSGFVDRIADEAEFTPRNVQTLEGRLTTVYAVKISLPNLYQELKPGMPADVTFLD